MQRQKRGLPRIMGFLLKGRKSPRGNYRVLQVPAEVNSRKGCLTGVQKEKWSSHSAAFMFFCFFRCDHDRFQSQLMLLGAERFPPSGINTSVCSDDTVNK